MTETLTPYTVEGEVLTAIEAWADGLATRVNRLHDDLWDLIDYIADGYEAHGDEIYDHGHQVGLSLSRMRSYCLTGRNFPPFRRGNLPALTPAHFEQVNALAPSAQDEMLRLAKEKKLSRDELRAECRQRRLDTSRPIDEVMMDNHYLQARDAQRTRGRALELGIGNRRAGAPL